MDFNELKTQIKNAGANTVRTDNDDYMEVVVKKDNLVKVIAVLESLLGKAVWPSKDKLVKEAQKMVDNLGGLRKGQTLFFSDKDGLALFAMLWPWQDGEKTTVKTGKVL